MNIKSVRIIFFLALLALPLCPSFSHGAQNVKSVLLYNMTTGKILYELNANLSIAPASLTKLMTMFLTMDAIKAKKLSLNTKIRIPRQAARTGGSAMHLRTGEKVPAVRLITGMVVASGNDAATALAIHIGENQKNFVRRMNAKAKALGMRRTVFKNPTGLPAAGQKTCANDLLLLCRAYLRAHPKAKRFHSMKWYMHKGSVAHNTNPLLGVIPGVDGLKTGWTVASGYNLIVTAQRGKTRLLAILLGGASKEARTRLARTMIEAGFRHPNNPALVRRAINRR